MAMQTDLVPFQGVRESAREGHFDYLKPKPVARKHTPVEFKVAIIDMAKAIIECLAAAPLDPADKSVFVIANRWARVITMTEFEFLTGDPLMFITEERQVVGPSKKMAHRIASILWTHRDHLSPALRPTEPPSPFVK
jgi:hypothetical protein